MLAGVIGRAVRKIQPAEGDGAPVVGKSVGAVGAMLLCVGRADGGGCLDVGVELDDVGILPGDVLEYAGELIDKTQEGDQSLHIKQLTWNPMLVDIAKGDQRVNANDQHLCAEPFPFIDQRAAAEGPKDALYLIQETGFHTLFQP